MIDPESNAHLLLATKEERDIFSILCSFDHFERIVLLPFTETALKELILKVVAYGIIRSLKNSLFNKNLILISHIFLNDSLRHPFKES